MDKTGIIKNAAGALLFSFLLTACQTGEIAMEPASESLLEVTQDITTDITRSVVTGSSLNVQGCSYGLIICKHEDSPSLYEAYDKEKSNLYANIQAWYGNFNSKGTKWWYSYESTSDARFEPLYLVSEDTTQHLDIYAYSPWKKNVTIQDGYTYDLTSVNEASLPDVMYATYEGGDGSTPTNKNHSIGRSSIPVSLHFHHTLARICFHFKLATAQNTGLDGQHAVRLYTIKLLRDKGSATPLYTRGNMNLLTGALTTDLAVVKNEQTVTYATSQSSTDGIGAYDIYQDNVWKEFNMLLHPVAYQADGDFTFQFWFNGTENGQTLIQTYDIPRDVLKHTDDSYGFKGGCCYDFYFVIDNYIHLQNVSISEWTDTDEEEIKV